MSDAIPSASPPRGWFPAPRVALPLIGAVAIAARLLALPASTEGTMEPDSPHFMNIARCFERGQGFSNPAVWPSWLDPASLPIPETIKEPAFPWLIALLAPLAGGEFPAGVLISLLAGVLAPFALFALARNLRLEHDVAVLAALLVAANPLAIEFSVRVMSDSLFMTALTAVFALAAIPPREGRNRPWWLEGATGFAAGLTFLVRSETLTAVPALAALYLMRGPTAATVRGALVAAVAALLAAAPLLLRNQQLFGTPLYSDAAPFGILGYVDQVQFTHTLDRPGSWLSFVLSHLPQVLTRTANHVAVFAAGILPMKVAGNPVWIVPLVAGALLALARWRTLAFTFLYVAVSLAFMFPITRDARHYLGPVPIWALWIAMGTIWIANSIGARRLAGPLTGRHLLTGALVLVLGIQAVTARREVARYRHPEYAAARALAPLLRERVAPGESAMVLTTSMYTWFADRPTVHFVIADEARFVETVRRLRVRLAVLPTDQLTDLAERFPERRLPGVLVPEREDAALGVTIFAVRDEP